MNKRFFTLMAAVMLAGAPLCNEAYAALANRANTITAVTSSAELQNGTKFIIKTGTTASSYYQTKEVPNSETGVTYATFDNANATAATATVFEATNVKFSPLGVSFELTVNGKPFALLEDESAINGTTKKDEICKDFTVTLKTGQTEYKLNTVDMALIKGTASSSIFASAALQSYRLDYNSVNLNEFSLSSTTFSFGSEAVEGNVFEGVVPFTFDRLGDLKASSPKGTYFVKGSDKDVKALKDATNQTDREAALKKLSVVTVLNEAYGINTSIPGEGYKLALVSGEEFYKAKDAANFANAAFINILENDQLNAEGEIELAIKPIINKADGSSVVNGTKLTIKSVKASVSDPKTYVTTVATNTKFEKVTNPVLGASTFFAATDFLKADEVSAYNVFFTSGVPQPENVTPQEYGRYLSAVSVYDRTSTANVYQLHATAPDNTIVDAPLSQWIVTNFDGKYTLTLKNREAGTTLNLKLEATDNAGEYNIIGGSDATTKITNVVADNQNLKGRTIKLIPTTLTKNDGYVVLSKEDMAGTIGVSFSGKDAIKGNQTYYMELNKNKTAFVPTLKASDAVEVNFALNKVDETASSTDLVINNYAYLDKDGRILTDAADTLAIPSYTVSYKIDKDTYYVTGGNLAVTKAKTATAAGAKKVVLKKHFNDSYALAIPSNVNDAKNANEVAVKPNGSKFASTAKINALKDADFAYVSLSLQDMNDYETLKAVSRHATFEAVNVAGGVSMQENKNGILEGIIGADALTFWLDTADSEKATPSFYISKGIAKAETKAYNDEVRNFLFNPTDSAAIYNEGSATTAVDKKYILEGTKENLKAIFRPAALIAEDTMTTVVDGKELTVVAAKADAAKDQVNGLKNFQYGISLADKDVANEYIIKSRGNGQYLYNLNGKLGFTSNKNEALVVTLGEGDATANEAIAAENVAVIAGEGVVTVKGAAGKQVVVSNILGQVIANKVATSDEETIAVAAGVAVVVVDGEATKVVVK